MRLSIEWPENFTWLDLIAILTFVILVALGIGLPTAKFLLHKRHWFRRFIIDSGTHLYDRNYGTSLENGETFQRTAKLILNEPGPATMVLRVRSAILRRPRHNPQLSFRHLRFGTLTQERWRPWRRAFHEASPDVIHGEWNGDLKTTPPSWQLSASSRQVDHIEFRKGDRYVSDYAYLRLGVYVGKTWSGVLLIDTEYQVEDWRWNFATATVEKTPRVPLEVSIAS